MAYAINRCVQDRRGHSGRQANRIDDLDELGIQCDSDGESNSQDAITVQDIESKMMLAHSPALDVLVRTSGVSRLSDFMLWQVRRRFLSRNSGPSADQTRIPQQCTNSQLQFTQRYWPLFGLRELVPIILDYQRMKMRAWLEERAW